MSVDKIIEGNELIAVFMGAEYNDTYNPEYPHYTIDDSTFYPEELLYHSSFDWLIPVVEKIEAIKDEDNCYLFSFDIGRDFCVICHNNLTRNAICAHSENGNKKMSIWNAIIKFLSWYNSNKSK